MSDGGGEVNGGIDVDGSTLEGGGQILRMALSFSALLKKPTRIFNIRAGRDSPGLKAQHLCGCEMNLVKLSVDDSHKPAIVANFSNLGVKLIGNICCATLDGAMPGSQEVVFKPGEIVGGPYNADTGTAGSVGLLLQVALPPLLFAHPPGTKSTLTLRGGTNADMAPQVDYLKTVFAPIAKKFGAEFDLKILRRGYFPKGGGEIEVTVKSVESLHGVDMLDMGKIERVEGFCFVAGVLPLTVAYEMHDSAMKLLHGFLPEVPDINMRVFKEDPKNAVGSGTGVMISAITSTGMVLGGSSLGKKGKRADKVGQEAAEEIHRAVKAKACVDKWAQDQVIILMALAEGVSKMRTTKLTMHTKTAIFVAEVFSGAKFKVEEKEDHAIIECLGIGLKTSHLQ